jgi:phosphate transport system permease protein
MRGLALMSASLVLVIGAALAWKSRQVVGGHSLVELFLGSSWKPSRGEFGFLPFIAGTIWVTVTASIIAIPPAILTSLYLTEYADKRLGRWIDPLIDILAGIPSIVYGIWGVLVVVPFIKDRLAPLAGVPSAGYSVLAGGTVLAIMIVPIIMHVSCEVLRSVPKELKEASLALGATKWQTIKGVVLKRTMPGMVAACVLGISRAFGETMAVLMVVGNVAKLPKTVFSPAYPLPALIANHYGEMLSIPMYDSALLFAALILFLAVFYFNMVARMILTGSKWSVYYGG